MDVINYPCLNLRKCDRIYWEYGSRDPLRWRHNELDGVSDHQPHNCLLSRLFRRRSKKPSKLRVTGLCAGNSPGTGEFPAQKASNAENVSIWWRHCYVAICDRRNLWRCRNLWLKVSQFVTDVAICDGKCRNLWQRQNMQLNDIYSLNFDKYFVLSSYLY